MIFLNAGILKPELIFINIISLPMIALSLIATFLDFEIKFLVISLSFVILYFVIVFCIFRTSKSKKYYLYVENNSLISNYPNMHCPKINIENIVRIEYYKISSLKNWFLLHSYLLPQCVFITYQNDGVEVCDNLGYPRLNEIKKICTDAGINFVIK